MKKLITKAGVIKIDCRVPDKLYFENEGISEIDNYIVIDMSDETFNFLNQIAHVSCPAYGEKIYTVNGIEFKVVHSEEES